jgi:hypothetical protein
VISDKLLATAAKMVNHKFKKGSKKFKNKTKNDIIH